MLNFFDPHSRYHRRAFLQVGSLALGGLALPQLLSAAESKRTITDKSVIFLFLHGGPPQQETFDPKMSAPSSVRCTTEAIQTKLPGVQFGAMLPRLAAMADRLAVVRSYVPGDANHDIKPVVCRDSAGANLGTIYARMAGINHPTTMVPSNVALYPRAVDSRAQPAVTAFGQFGSTGPFGSACAPFDPSGGGPLLKDMSLQLPMDRLSDRRQLLTQLDRVQWALSEGRLLDGLDKTRQQAYGTLLGGVVDAFNLAKEDPKVVARYDTEPLIKPESISKKWNNHKNYLDNARSLGKLLLLARRLCERGCGFVTVTTNFVWDFHADVNNAGAAEGMRYMGLPLDHAVSAFLEDVAARGLDEKILLVACGEMGRTPGVNKGGGRDHWGNLGPLLLAGGGLKMGQVIGQSDRQVGEPRSEPVRIRNVIATILQTLFDVGELRLVPGVPREIATMLAWDPIPGLSV
jgi:uncharacterized protein (DUF1501 family)